MPNVPKVPGVPPLLSYATNSISLLVGDAISALLGQLRPTWGLFKNGIPVVICDTVGSFDFKKSWAVADYPVENGAFESYDKVETPFEVRLRFASGGSLIAREELLASIEAIANTTDLFDAVTPERIYQNVNPQHYDYRRTADHGVGLLVVDLWCTEIRDNAISAFTSTKNPTSASTINGGTVQPTTLASAQSSALEFQ